MELSIRECLIDTEIQHADVPALCSRMLSLIRARQSDSARVVALSGPLGAGKTTMSQEIARQLGVTDVVTSPTFVIEKRYQTTEDDFRTLLHIDAYRVESTQELEVLHFSESCTDAHTLVLIEWAERVVDILPTEVFLITLAHSGEGIRHVQCGWTKE